MSRKCRKSALIECALFVLVEMFDQLDELTARTGKEHILQAAEQIIQYGGLLGAEGVDAHRLEHIDCMHQILDFDRNVRDHTADRIDNGAVTRLDEFEFEAPDRQHSELVNAGRL